MGYLAPFCLGIIELVDIIIWNFHQTDHISLFTAENINTLSDSPLGENYDIIVLDGTWRQAKDIFHNNPFLCQARQVGFQRSLCNLNFDIVN